VTRPARFFPGLEPAAEEQQQQQQEQQKEQKLAEEDPATDGEDQDDDEQNDQHVLTVLLDRSEAKQLADTAPTAVRLDAVVGVGRVVA
jgi:hypothetical protein